MTDKTGGKLQRVLGLALAVLLVTPLAACSEKRVTDAYPDKKAGFQLDKPEKGEKIAVMHTSMGDIKIRFFPKAAPKAVKNFQKHATDGYYDGITFHRVMNDFMIQSGDPKGDGTGGESIWGKPFEDEFDSKLLNLRGALSMANSGINTNGSQFFITQAPAKAFAGKADFESKAKQYEDNYSQAKVYYKQQYDQNKTQIDNYYGSFEAYFKASYFLAPDPDLVPDDVWALYEKYGGNIALDGAWRESGGHTVFGQVFEGMDVVDAIAAVETVENESGEKSKPKTDVKINTIEIVEYNG